MLSELLKLLTKEQKHQLRYAFEQGISQYIELPNNKFVGVNLQPTSVLKILESKNEWSAGEIIHG